MDIPWSAIALTSIAGSFALLRLTLQYSPTTTYIGTFFCLLLVQVVASTVWSTVLYPYLFSPLRHLPQPPGASFFNGHFAKLSNNPTGFPHREWIETVPNDGIIMYKTLLNRERLFLTSPKALSEVLTTKCYDFVRPAMIGNRLARILGVGILLAEGDEHKRQRHLLKPAFEYRHIKDLHPTFWTISCKLVNTLTLVTEKKGKESVHGLGNAPVIEFDSWASRATLDIIGVAGTGQDFNAIEDPDTELNTTYRKIFQPGHQARILGLMSLFLPQWFLRSLPLSHNEDIAEASETIRKVARQLIHQKQQKLARIKQEEQEKWEYQETRDKDILSVALESGGFSEEDLVNQMMTFLAAGHETTASAMTWSIYLLCKHPGMQTRLREEVRIHLPSPEDSSVTLTAAALDQCHYLRAFCNEVLRVYSVVPLTFREAAHGTSILGQFVPKGTVVILAPWAINTATSMWGANGAVFSPDRWMEPGKSNTGGANSNYAFMTFLHGPRACIGQKFATAEFACLLAAVVGRFELELEDKEYVASIKVGVTARPKEGVNVRVKTVDGW